MGMMTGAVEGIIRDILINEVPLIFKKDIYAMACVAGGVITLYATNLTATLYLQKFIGSCCNSNTCYSCKISHHITGTPQRG